jgi:protein-S-isoprenylcysteine O-methyltransferase Ste14
MITHIEQVLLLAAPFSTTVVLVAVARSFVEAGTNRSVADRRPSVVATASMMAFFVAIYLLIHHKIGFYLVYTPIIRLFIMIIGALLMVAGAVVNVIGRGSLGRNWANQATLYEDQTLVTTGVFSIARHPLYSSLIWMFYGASLLYENLYAALATTLVFAPAMYYRASLEEKLLSARFSGYAAYRRRVGMLFPKLPAGKDVKR